MKYTICGGDLVPIVKKDKEGNEYVLFCPRIIVLDDQKKAYSTIVGMGRDIHEAHGDLIAFIGGYPIGDEVSDRIIEKDKFRFFRIQYPKLGENLGMGEVVGYLALYLNEERGCPSQLVKALALLSSSPDGKQRNVYARINPPGTCGVDPKNLTTEIRGAVDMMAGHWGLGTRVRYIPKFQKTAYYLLGEDLPEETKPSEGSIAQLAEKWGSRIEQ